MPYLAIIDSPTLTPLSVGTSIVVFLLAVTMAVIAFRASKRRSNRALTIVGIAFLVFAMKNAFSAVNVATHLVPHDVIELVLSLFDLALLLLLFLPFFGRRRAEPEGKVRRPA